MGLMRNAQPQKLELQDTLAKMKKCGPLIVKSQESLLLIVRF